MGLIIGILIFIIIGIPARLASRQEHQVFRKHNFFLNFKCQEINRSIADF